MRLCSGSAAVFFRASASALSETMRDFPFARVALLDAAHNVMDANGE
jgi:hypothetical protein